jgi:hypothetical protein
MPINEPKQLRFVQASHPSEDQLRYFMLGELPRNEARIVVRHLLTSCPQCTAVTRRFWQFGDGVVLSLTLIGAEARRSDVPRHHEPL